MSKLIVGLVGPVGVGKTTVANYLISKNFVRHGFSDPLRSELQEKNLAVTRESLQDLGDFHRAKHGLDFLAKQLIKRINDSQDEKVVVDGFRNPGEVEAFIKLPNFILIGLNADPKVRFERLKKRNLPHDPKTWEDFQKQEVRDQGIGQPVHGQKVLKSLELASFIVDTDKVESKVFEQIEEIINNYQKNDSRKNTTGSEECSFC